MQSEKHAESYFMMRNSSIHSFFFLWPFLVVAAHAAKKSTHSVRLCYICDLRFASFRLVLYTIRVLFTTARERERRRILSLEGRHF